MICTHEAQEGGKNRNPGDSVAIPEPNLLFHRSQHKGKDYSFSNVRVETPLLLVVNGKPQGSRSQAAASGTSWP